MANIQTTITQTAYAIVWKEGYIDIHSISALRTELEHQLRFPEIYYHPEGATVKRITICTIPDNDTTGAALTKSTNEIPL